MTLFAWDASDFDWARGPMDLQSAYNDGIRVFTHKATESTGTKHIHYGEALNRAKAAGIPYLGAYVVVRSGNVSAQADYFLNYVNAATPWWKDHPGFFFQVDLELWPYDQVAGSQGVQMAELLRQRTGKPVVLYASKGQYGDRLGGDAPLWNANYGNNPAGHYRELYPGDKSSRWAPYSGRTPLILQYGSRLTIGRQSTCDANAIRDESAWKALFQNGEDLMAGASDIIEAWAQGLPKTADGHSVEPVGWRIRDEAWQKSVSADIAALKARPVTVTQIDTATLSAALQAPEFLAALAKAVNDDAARRLAQ